MLSYSSELNSENSFPLPSFTSHHENIAVENNFCQTSSGFSNNNAFQSQHFLPNNISRFNFKNSSLFRDLYENIPSENDSNQASSCLSRNNSLQSQICLPNNIPISNISLISTNLPETSNSNFSPNKIRDTPLNPKQTKKIKKKNLQNKKYSDKNLLKMVANTILKKTINNQFKDDSCISRLLRMTYESIIYPSNFLDLIDVTEFSSWVKSNILTDSLSSFADFRSFFTQKIEKKDCKTQHFISVYRNLIRWFLQNEVYDCFIFEKTLRSVDPAMYLKKIPRFYAGLNQPEHFISLNL